MEIIAIIYIAICCLLLPFYQLWQEYEGRGYPFIGLSVLFAGCLIVGGYPLPFDNITIATLSIALWLAASLLWGSHPHSLHELFNWLSYLVLFTAARIVPIDFILLCVFAVGIIFALCQLYNQIVLKLVNPFFILGNPSHNSALMLSGLLAGIWLTGSALIDSTSASLIVLSILTIVTGIAIITTKSKGAILSLFVSLLFMGIMLKNLIILTPLFVMAIAGITIFIKGKAAREWRLSCSWRERLLIFGTALTMIREKPIFGHGLQMFRKLMPFTVAKLYKSKWFGRQMEQRTLVCQDAIYANKVHNDHLETIVELGLFGYILFVYLFTQMTFDVYMTGFFIMAMTSSLTFFYFRNTHTAVPFWAIMGSATGIGASTESDSNMFILKVVGVAVLFVIIKHTFKKLTGMAYFSAAIINPDITAKINLTQKAIDCDPDNGDYLNYYAYNAFAVRQPQTLFCIMKGIINYDGNRQIWGLWDMFSRLIFNMDKIRMAEWGNINSRTFFPDYPASKEMTNNIETMKLVLGGKVKEAQDRINLQKGA